MKKMLFSLVICIMACMSVHGQENILIQRPGILTDLASAAGAIITLPLAVVEGVVVGTADAAASLIHGSTQIVVTPPVVAIPVPSTTASPTAVTLTPAVQPSTTITTRYSDGSVVQVTRPASAYEPGSVILVPVDPAHRVGSSPHVNPYVYRPR